MAAGDLPKYLAIADSLRARIESGEFDPGDQFPSQHTMARDHGVTVMTLRQALAQLEAEGLVHASKGRGTFVSEPRTVRFGLDHLWSFAQEMASHGVEVQTDIVAIDDAPTGAPVGAAHSALSNTDVVEVVRLRSIDTTPVVLQRSFVRASDWSRLDASTLGGGSMYAALARDAGRVLERASEVFRATLLGTNDADALSATPGEAAMESSRTSFDSNDEAFLFDRALLLGSATEIRAERTADSMRLGYGTTQGPTPPDATH